MRDVLSGAIQSKVKVAQEEFDYENDTAKRFLCAETYEMLQEVRVKKANEGPKNTTDYVNKNILRISEDVI